MLPIWEFGGGVCANTDPVNKNKEKNTDIDRNILILLIVFKPIKYVYTCQFI